MNTFHFKLWMCYVCITNRVYCKQILSCNSYCNIHAFMFLKITQKNTISGKSTILLYWIDVGGQLMLPQTLKTTTQSTAHHHLKHSCMKLVQYLHNSWMFYIWVTVSLSDYANTYRYCKTHAHYKKSPCQQAVLFCRQQMCHLNSGNSPSSQCCDWMTDTEIHALDHTVSCSLPHQRFEVHVDLCMVEIFLVNLCIHNWAVLGKKE